MEAAVYAPLFGRALATVIFTDLVDSTRRAAEMGDERWRMLLDRHDTMARAEVTRFGGRFIKTTGDGTLATFDAPSRAIKYGRSICEAVRELGVAARAGLHTGEIETRGDDIGGIAVHIAARVSELARGDEVLASQTVVDLCAGSGIEFAARGAHSLEGVPGEWGVFSVLGATQQQ